MRIEEQVVRAVRRALANEAGVLLVFLPGQGEIVRVAERLAERVPDPAVEIAPLYGALDTAAQDRAIAPARAGRRKVVLATSIAQTSLTIEGVRVVIDAGLARVPRYDPASGLTRLDTVRVSRGGGRPAARQGGAHRAPGVCYRLWDERETRGLASFDRPEILEADLARVALDLAPWGAGDGAAWLPRPPPAAAHGRGARAAAAAGRAGRGRRAHAARAAHGRHRRCRRGWLTWCCARRRAARRERAARIAALIAERGLGGRGVDLERAWRRSAATAARGLATPMTSPRAGRRGWRARRGATRRSATRLLLAEAWPERIAKARGGAGEFQLASGRGVFMDPAEPLAKAPWLAVAELGGGAGARPHPAGRRARSGELHAGLRR